MSTAYCLATTCTFQICRVKALQLECRKHFPCNNWSSTEILFKWQRREYLKICHVVNKDVCDYVYEAGPARQKSMLMLWLYGLKKTGRCQKPLQTASQITLCLLLSGKTSIAFSAYTCQYIYLDSKINSVWRVQFWGQKGLVTTTVRTGDIFLVLMALSSAPKMSGINLRVQVRPVYGKISWFVAAGDFRLNNPLSRKYTRLVKYSFYTSET